MRIQDELKAYQGDLSYEEIIQKVAQINDQENQRFHPSYQKIPILELKKEKDSLIPLPTENIRNPYLSRTLTVKVNASSLFSYQANPYSVAPEYIGKHVQLQVHHHQIYVYYNRKLIGLHQVSRRKLNYLEEPDLEIVKKTLPFDVRKR